MSSYVSLHTHSEFSLLDGLSKIKDLIKKAKEFEMPALAITDHGSMYGAIKFYLMAKEAGIKPIIGMEGYQAQNSRFDRLAGERDQFHILLLAKNFTGYQNLMKLTSLGHLEGFYYKPRVDWEVLEKYHEGIVATSACTGGLISYFLEQNDLTKAQETALKYQQIFGKENFYLEIQHHPGLDHINALYEKIAQMSRKLAIPLVATNDSHYTNKDDATAQETLLCIQTQKTWNDTNRPLSMIDCPDFYFKSPAEMEAAFIQYPDALENTLKIASMCDLEIPIDKYIFPPFEIPKNETYDSFLRKEIDKSVGAHYAKVTDAVRARIEHELGIIQRKGYSSYFLIVSDFARWAKERGILCNARGSGAGSIIAYILDISALDPLRYKLPFERFLHDSRPTPPDIDMDLQDDSRDLVIDYVKSKYGEDKVGQIVTFGTMEARGAVRDVARALGYPYAVGDRISKMIPPGSQGFPMSLEKALELNSELKTAFDTEQETKKIFELAEKLEGVARHASVHAAGVVISDGPLTDYTPVQKDPKGGKLITQYDMYSLDLNASKHAVGLLKMDFLGLRNLTILGQAIKLIKKYRNQVIDLNKLPLDDRPVYEMVSKGDTTGVFQLESSGMRKLARELQPSVIDEFGAMVALFRPGPMEIIPDYISRKKNPKSVVYLHPDLEPILSETYGLIIYQEQVMEIAHRLAGYTMEEADGFRKAMGKKLPELMKKEGEKFKAGLSKNSYTSDFADKLFALIEKFAAYGFNKAHSATYGLLAYYTAYMKVHYPIEFMTAMLSAESRGNTGETRDEKIQMCIDECRRMNVKVLSPSINESVSEFSISNESIRFGLTGIRNVGEAAIETIIQSREKDGPFTSITNFCRRVDLQKVNKKVLESLIKSGALDTFGKRAAMLFAMDEIISSSHKLVKKAVNGQAGLFDDFSESDDSSLAVDNIVLPDIDELPQEELLMNEREYLGVFLTQHPHQDKLEKLSHRVPNQIENLSMEEDKGKVITVGGLVTSIRKVYTKKNNDEMAFITLQSLNGAKLDCVVFPKLFTANRKFWVENNVLVCTGRLDNRDEKLSLIIDSVEKID